MSILPLPIEDEVDRIISDLDLVFGETRSQASAGSQRQILVVRRVQFFTAAHVLASAPNRPERQTYVRLLGDPSPSSEVTNGYIRFGPPGSARLPSYDAGRKMINLWVDQDDMAMTLAQLQHAERYLWIGIWDSGHIYGDLHSTP